MSDLIDLDCSRVAPSLDLVQPLIPAPKNEVPLVGLRSDENRRSVGSNPFDRVLEETMEYTQKKEDPFEQVLEKALRCNSEYLTPKKQKKPSDVLKMNKTLDESVFDYNNDSNDFLGERKNNEKGNSLQGAAFQIDGEIDKKNPEVLVHSPSPLNSSILNYSVMNDTLFEDTENAEEKMIKSIVAQRISKCVEKATLEAGNMLGGNLGTEHKLVRSLSQRSPLSMKRTRAFRQRSQSTLETLKDLHNHDGSMISLKSTNTLDDEMNKAFLRSRSQISVASTFSNISPIMRLNSMSILSSLSSGASICPINCAFLESGSKEDELSTSLNISFQTKGDVLEKRALNSSAKHKMEDEKIVRVGKEEGKLIDVEDFVSSKEETNEYKSSSTDSSSDSVFTNSSRKVDKSILKAAKMLAKTFEELANSTAASNSEELINSVPQWNFEDLPESGDEESAENLIELPVTPGKVKLENGPSLEEQIKRNNIEVEDSSNKSKDSLKSLETEFLDPQGSEKKDLTTLFLDLEKVIESKNNPEAVNLLGNLERILGVECKNNAELLTLCLDNTNDLSKCSRKSETKMNCSENIMEEQIDKSNEDNLNQEIPPMDVNVNKEINLDEKSKTKTKIEVNESFEMSTAEQNTENLNSSDNAATCLLKDLGKVLQEQVQDPKVLSLFQSLGKILSDVSKGNNVENYQIKNSQTPESLKKDNLRKRGSQEDVKKKPRRKSFSNTGYRHSLDSPNVPKASEKYLRKSMSTNISFNSSFSNGKSKSRLIDTKKRYPSDPSGLNILELNKKKTDSPLRKNNAAKVATNKDTSTRIPADSILPNNQKVRTITSAIDSAKNQIKLKKKVDGTAGNKRGPLKAVIPLGNMQRHGSSERTMTPRVGGVTPPKSGGSTRANLTIPSSTPNSITGSTANKSKPVASSTPEGTIDKFHRYGQSPTKRYSSANSSRRSPCNISPVTTYNGNNDSSLQRTPKRNNSISSPRAKTSSFNRSYSDTEKKSPVSHIPQRQSNSIVKSQAGKYVPSQKKIGLQPSPLKNSNSINSKVKSDNLISKIKRQGGEKIAEKENTYA